MTIRNIKYNKRRLGALLAAGGLVIGGIAFGVNHINNKAKEKTAISNKPSYKIFFTVGNQSFVSNGEQIGYLDNQYLDMPSELDYNFTLMQQDLYINNNADIYFYPYFDGNKSCILNKGTKVVLNAISDDGWAVIHYMYNGEVKVGFVHASFLQQNDPNYVEVVSTPEPVNNKILVAKITADKVNVRSTTETKTNNRIGFCNTDDIFTIKDKVGSWYLVDYYGKEGYISDKYVLEEEVEEADLQSTISTNEVIVAKITGNNVNVRSSMSTRSDDNIIGFCDISDRFEIIDHNAEWYHIKYLNKEGYVHSKYVREITVDKSELNITKMCRLSKDAPFYNENGNILCYLPINQNVLIIGEKDNKYKVIVDGVVGYVNKKETKNFTRICIVVDNSRQIVKAYRNGKEVFRAHVITGADGMDTNLGCYTIGHHMEGFTFEDNNIYNEYWIQFDHNRGFHPADANAGKGWQKKEYFIKVADRAYQDWARGRGKNYPYAHGSHGCVNMKIDDVRELYELCSVGDTVLVINQNDLIKNNCLSSNDNSIYFTGNNIYSFEQDSQNEILKLYRRF